MEKATFVEVYPIHKTGRWIHREWYQANYHDPSLPYEVSGLKLLADVELRSPLRIHEKTHSTSGSLTICQIPVTIGSGFEQWNVNAQLYKGLSIYIYSLLTVEYHYKMYIYNNSK